MALAGGRRVETKNFGEDKLLRAVIETLAKSGEESVQLDEAFDVLTLLPHFLHSAVHSQAEILPRLRRPVAVIVRLGPPIDLKLSWFLSFSCL